MWISAQQSEPSSAIEALEELSARHTATEAVPFSAEIVDNIPVYQGDDIRRLVAADAQPNMAVQDLQAEWIQVLLEGAGVLLVRNAIDDLVMLDGVTAMLQQIIDEESRNHAGTGAEADHFAAAGANTRLWNAHEKLCMRAPELFARYNANDALSLVCRAWLGPAYQITAQVNIVHPGGRAQICHRDYHMGFQDEALLSQYPAHVHSLSPLLTLQGGIAHSDVPMESGPTQLLPFSQLLLPGYMCASQPAVRKYFEEHYVQVALNKGDMLFFNPALLHAAGDNNTADHHRFVNLMQIGSAYGRTLELLDRARMATHLYPVLQSLMASGGLSARGIEQVIEACAEGYAFPASMDLEPPAGGLAPESQQAMMLRALQDGLSAQQFARQVQHQQSLKRSH